MLASQVTVKTLKNKVSAKTTVKRQSRRNRVSNRSLSIAANLQMQLEGGSYKLPVTLPKKGERVFSLQDAKEIGTFLKDLTAEDASISQVAVSNKHGERISRSMPIHNVLLDDWIVSIDSKNYYVTSPLKASLGNGHAEVSTDAAASPNFAKAKEWVMDKGRDVDFVALRDYVEHCEDVGIQSAEALTLLKQLNQLGVVSYFGNTFELSGKIMVRPTTIGNAIESALDIPLMRRKKEHMRIRIAEIEAELQSLMPEKLAIEAKAKRTANTIAYSLLAGLSFQFLLFARLTWWDSDWDVMEPVTYFTMTAETSVAAYIYYLIQKSEYTNLDFRTWIVGNRLKAIAKRKRFDWKRFERLEAEKKDIEAQLEMYHL